MMRKKEKVITMTVTLILAVILICIKVTHFVIIERPCGMKFSNMYKDYQKLQFNQEQIDTQVSVLMSMLFSDLYYSDPIDLGETKEHADELSVLLQVTSYDEIPHFNDIANKLIEISKNVESRPAFSEQTIELFQSFIYNLGKPLSDDIDTLSTSLYESIMSESVEG